MPALGGKPRVLKRAARNARFSPDGQWLAYLTLEAAGSIRLLPAAGDKERRLAQGLVDVETATWSPDSRHLMVVGHPDASVELDCWVVPIDGAPPVDTRVLQRARQQGFVVISTSHAWAGDSIFFSAAWRQGVHVWRQRIAPGTFESIGAPEPMTPGAEMAFFPTAARNRLAFVGIHSDTNIWSIALDAASGTPYGPLRRLTRGPGIVGHLTSSQDGRALAYFAVRTLRGELHVRNLESGSETIVEGDPAFNPGFPTISPGGEQIAYSALVPGPPLQRPVLIASLVDGKSRLVRDDCGGRPRQWLDEQTLLVETFGSGLNSFFLLDTRDGSQRPLLSAAERKVSNPRISPDGRWLAFDAMPPGGSPEVAVAPIGRGTPVQESEWTLIREPASHPFWSRDGRLLYYLAMFPNVDIRSRILARGFDTSTGRVEDRPTDILTLREMIVPAMVTGTAPIVAPDQIIFVLGDFRGDVWIREI
jgi:Tol biopolymer transport system component